ncbi:MAG: hypothetical protein Q8S02_01125 [Hydrogenophaga sp.]|nr:hypothetical protein [Hydrogenophaga sp.]
MNESLIGNAPSAPVRPAPILSRQNRLETLNRLALKEERLPFSVRVVRGEGDLRKAVAIRHAAYARHVPDLAERLREPEDLDREDGVAVLLAESKLDGTPLGSARIQTNRFRALSVEQSVALPEHMAHLALAEVTRLGIVGGSIGRLVKVVLIKAAFQYCEREGLDWAIAAGRAPIDKHYEQMLFQDLYPEVGFLPLKHAGNLPHRVMAFEIATGPARWSAAQHPLLDFFCHTRHPDIDLGARRPAVQPIQVRPDEPQGPAWADMLGNVGRRLRGLSMAGQRAVA